MNKHILGVIAMATILLMACVAQGASTDKTLVSWVILKDKSVRAGSAITVQLGIEFDGIVFAEREKDKWMAGSDYFLRTQEKQAPTPVETADDKALIQMAIVYKDDHISIYRNGELYDSYNAKNVDLLSSKDNSVVFGARCVSGVGSIGAAIEDARIYSKALSVEEIKSLEPNKKSSIRPYAWWDFEGNKVVDRAGRYSRSKFRRGARLTGGKLVLGKKGMMVAGKVKQPTVNQGRIYSRAKKGSYSIPPELVNFKKTQSRLQVVNAKEFGFDKNRWQSDPSRIIYHGGKYHVWMIDGFVNHVAGTTPAEWKRRVNLKRSWILYMTSKDTVHWKAEHYLPLGPKGSAYDLTIEQANVLYHKGKFYLFAEGWTSNIEKYGQMNAGIICLVADSPEGPWKQAGDILVKPGIDDKNSWDCRMALNPRHVYINGKWHMYYKGMDWKKGPTENGLAIADSITGPYTKHKGNPLLWGHGHFCWRYKHGMLMLPFWTETILWSEDGIHFSEPLAARGNELFLFGSLYVPHDSLCGEPVTDKPVTKYWGLETKSVEGGDWDVVRIEWEFGAQEENE